VLGRDVRQVVAQRETSVFGLVAEQLCKIRRKTGREQLTFTLVGSPSWASRSRHGKSMHRSVTVTSDWPQRVGSNFYGRPMAELTRSAAALVSTRADSAAGGNCTPTVAAAAPDGVRRRCGGPACTTPKTGIGGACGRATSTSTVAGTGSSVRTATVGRRDRRAGGSTVSEDPGKWG